MKTKTTSQVPSVEKALSALRRRGGISAARLQDIAGWKRKPTKNDLRSFAQRRGYLLNEHLSAAGEPIFHFTLPERAPSGSARSRRGGKRS